MTGGNDDIDVDISSAVDDNFDILDASAMPTTRASVNGTDASRITKRRSNTKVVAFIFQVLETVLLGI